MRVGEAKSPERKDDSSFGLGPDQLDLTGVHGLIWDLLEQGVSYRHSPFHVPTVATVTDGGQPELRTVVLRHASRKSGLLGFHTDRRSAKFVSLCANSAVALHVYDPKLKIQVRGSGHAELHLDDEQARGAWEKSNQMSRVCYSQVQAPGARLDTPSSTTFEDQKNLLGHGTCVAGWANFVLVTVKVERLEWLYLKSTGNRRAMFCRNSLGEVAGTWLAP